ncbi:hypothetical protein LPJ61_000139 [Coemansia biformis]|uniref:TH1 protein n=1 Tax=Coemansia biformis TaxID=1286918 RepID=A0A9W7YJF6_9FUNG|nr:hypothetical protein LPJ61_000139 [Coemansia biformis]
MMSAPVNGSNGIQAPPGEAEQKRLAQEEAKGELCKQDAIMEPATSALVEQYLGAGGAPFNVMNMLMAGYEGAAAMANMVGGDVQSAFGGGPRDAALEALGHMIVDSFDAQKADSEYAATKQLPEYVSAMLPHAVWRKTIYRLSAKHPGSTMVGAALQHIAEQGYQAEMTSLNSASLHTHVFCSLLSECVEKISPANEENLDERMQELVGAVCRREQTYFVAQYVFRSTRERLGGRAAGLQRIEQGLETHMLDSYSRPQLVVHMRALLEGLAVGGGDRVANAVVSIIQSSYAAPGDVAALYSAFNGALAEGEGAPAVHILRNERVLQPIVEQAFGCLWGTAAQNQRPELVGKYVWLLAYAATCPSGRPMDDGDKERLQRLVAQMKEMREGLPLRPIQTHLNQAIPRILEWIGDPLLARVVLLWIQDVITFDSYTYYSMYFHSSEVPVPLLLLEEIAFRHPLLKPLVFAAYQGSFESRVPGFSLEKQLQLQKVAINRMAVLVQLDYAFPVLNYFSAKARQIDESVLVYFLRRTLAQFEAPYPDEFAEPMMQMVEHVMGGIRAAKAKEVASIREFLAGVGGGDDDGKAQSLLAALPQETAPGGASGMVS